jgi:hypothetical protein
MNVGIPQMRDALAAAKIRWIGYDVEFLVLRTGGQMIPEWEEAGFHTIDTSIYIGEDIFSLVKDEVVQLIIKNAEKQIKLSGMTDKTQIEMIRAIAAFLTEDLIKSS